MNNLYLDLYLVMILIIFILVSYNVNRSRPRTIHGNQYSVQVCGRNSAITLAVQISFMLRKTNANTNTNTCFNTSQSAHFPFLCMLSAYIFLIFLTIAFLFRVGNYIAVALKV